MKEIARQPAVCNFDMIKEMTDMDWYENLYIGNNAKKKKNSLIRKIESGKAPLETFLVTLSSGQVNQLEIISAWNLKFWYHRKNCPMIIGLACGQEEALELVVQITEEVLEKTGKTELKDYFLNHSGG